MKNNVMEDRKTGHRERMKTKYSQQGDSAFYDYQLLEMLLFYAIPRRDTKPIAKELLDVFGSLHNLQKASIEQITSVKGVGEETARLIKLTGDIYKRALDDKSRETTIHRLSQAGEYFKTLLENEPTEKYAIMLLNNGGKIQFIDIIGDGSPETGDMPIMKIVELVTARRASTVIIAHNHPNGDSKPSAADISKTQALIAFMKTLGAMLADHMIIGSDGIFSMRSDPEYVDYFI